MKKPNKTIRMKPREVRGRVVRSVTNGARVSGFYTAQQIQAMRRKAQVNTQESKPEGDAVSNLQADMKQYAEDGLRIAYKLTRAQIRFIRERVKRAKAASADTKTSTDIAMPDAEASFRETTFSAPDTSGHAASSDIQGQQIRASPNKETLKSQHLEKPSLNAATFDDPAKRPLSERELSKGRENQRRKRQMQALNKFQEKPIGQNAQQESIPPEGGSGASASAPSAQTKPPSVQAQKPDAPHIRQQTTDIHTRPEQALPKTRAAFQPHKEATENVIQRSERQAIKTADAATRTAAKQAAVRMEKAGMKVSEKAAKEAAKKAEKLAKRMAEQARHAAKRTADALKRAAKAAIRASKAAIQALIEVVAAGGGVAVVIIIVLLLCVSILASPFGIFTHTDSTELSDAISLPKAIETINGEYTKEINRLAGKHDNSYVVIEGNLENDAEPVNWVDVLAIFSVHLTMREENAMDVVQLDKTKLGELRNVFWDMNKLSIVSDTDDDGSKAYYVVGTCKSASEMIEPYRFSDQQKQLLSEIMSDEYYAFWSNFVSESTGNGTVDWGGVVSIDPNYKPSMSGNVMKIPAIYQFDYKKVVCVINGSKKSASSSGCGATSMCMVIHYLTGNKSPTPYTLFKWAYDNGHYNGDGLGHGAVSAIGKTCGVTGSWIGKDGKRIVSALKSGHPVIAHMGPGIFTNGGHYIVLRGVTDDGKILVNDPNSKSRTGKAYPLSTILNQSKTSTPFLICSKAN